jgi:hypothetical protein
MKKSKLTANRPMGHLRRWYRRIRRRIRYWPTRLCPHLVQRRQLTIRVERLVSDEVLPAEAIRSSAAASLGNLRVKGERPQGRLRTRNVTNYLMVSRRLAQDSVLLGRRRADWRRTRTSKDTSSAARWPPTSH